MSVVEIEETREVSCSLWEACFGEITRRQHTHTISITTRSNPGSHGCTRRIQTPTTDT